MKELTDQLHALGLYVNMYCPYYNTIHTCLLATQALYEGYL